MISADEARKKYYSSRVYYNTIEYIKDKIIQTLEYKENKLIIYNITKNSKDRAIINLYNTIENVVEYLKFYGYDVQYKTNIINDSYKLIIKW